jgi:phage/plasmid primase-like uncharacterized protein
MRGSNVVADSNAAAASEEDDRVYQDMLTEKQMEQNRRDKEEAPRKPVIRTAIRHLGKHLKKSK